MNIIQACQHPDIFEPFLTDRGTKPLKTWNKWMSCLRALYGLSIGPNASKTIKAVTHRDPGHMPSDGFRTALFLTGRRSGKSRMAAVIAVYEALLAGNESKLVSGETGVVPLISISKNQARVLRNYVSEILSTPLLKKELVSETKEGFELANGIEIRILAGDYRTVRGFTVVGAAILDEVAFYGIADEGKIKSNEELVRALEPAMITTKARLLSITSPYSRKGYVYSTYAKHFGNDASKTLVVNCPSKILNPTLDQSIIDEAMEEDPASARAEYYGEFRDDIQSFLSRECIEALVVTGRQMLLPRSDRTYAAFVDMSGGRSDDHAIAIGHKEQHRKVVIDFCKRYKPGTSPYIVVADMARQAGKYNIQKVTGDNYAAEWVSRSFADQQIRFVRADRNKSQIYLELLPRIGSGEIELLDNDVLVNQLAGLQRKTRSGGKDTIDHGPGGHDDLCNAVAGVSCIVSHGRRVATALRPPSDGSTYSSRHFLSPFAE